MVWAEPAARAGASVAPGLSGQEAAALWREIVSEAGPALAGSRSVLLGRRDPNGPSCVVMARGEKRPVFPGGGPGSRVAALYALAPANGSPAADYVWHQTTLKTALESLRETNREAAEPMRRLSDRAKDLAAALAAWPALPAELQAVQAAAQDHWPGYCLHALDEALAARDLAASRRWSAELSASLFALADLHRWLDFVASNHLEGLAFQAWCEPLFAQCERSVPAENWTGAYFSRFPAGILSTRCPDNYLEVERQGERLMRSPHAWAAVLTGQPAEEAGDPSAASAAVWLSPDLRRAFLRLRARLSAENRRAWDEAARSPFHRSYLANTLYRAGKADFVDALAVVLDRLNRRQPKASVADLMDVVFYRGGDPAGGVIEWGDRFDRRLVDAAGKLDGSDEQVLAAARWFTRDLFGGWENYSAVGTLEEALDTGRMSCIRATDMIGSLYRNSGRPGVYAVRWCGGLVGHSVSAVRVTRDGGDVMLLADGLDAAPTGTEVWPDAYKNGHAWPEGFPGSMPDIYAVELYGRGLDNYVWMEGYVIRGPHAGSLMKAVVPYMPQRVKAPAAHAANSLHRAGGAAEG